MKLLEIESIQSRLDEQFLPLEPILTGMRLVPSAAPNAVFNDCQRSLNVTFPLSFAAIVTRFDFGHFTIGPVAFCNRGDYFSWLTEINKGLSDHSWWGYGQRPNGVLMVANSDQFAILLDTRSEKVLGLEHGCIVSTSVFKVADSFDLLVRGLGTAFLERLPDKDNENLARQIAVAVSGNPENSFWLWIAA